MSESQNEAIKLYTDMKKGIESAGGSFFQYRACNLNGDTVYDLENIKNGVVYARSPLYMNDPFDSMIGFSSEVLCQDLCNILISNIQDSKTKLFVTMLLKEKAIGKVADFISTIKAFQAFLRAQKSKMNPKESDIRAFAIHECKNLYRKMSPGLKKKINNVNAFCAFALFTANIDMSMITEENLLHMFQLDKAQIDIIEKFDDFKTNYYIPQFKEFLSSMTVSCFSASGWNNQLMWSHYANSYSGICIEYDFGTVNGSTGFVYPVKYSEQRPTVTLKDLGFGITEEGKWGKTKDSTDVMAILSYLLTKNKCWEYENEWRIINFGQKDTPRFIDMPNIKSITLGLNINIVCKHLLFDICKDKKIPCYNLVLNTETFALDRQLIDIDNVEYNMDDELSFIYFILNHIMGINAKSGEIDINDIFDKERKVFNSIKFMNLVNQANDILFYIYCFKNTMNSFMRYADESVKEDTYNKLKESAKQVDDIVQQLNLQPDNAIDALKKIQSAGLLSLDDYYRAETILKTNQSLYNKVADISWDKKIIPE